MLKRVVIEWELDRPIRWAELARRILTEQSVLCVVNFRDHAGTLFDEVWDQCEPTERDSLFHLSTRMCARHRLDTFAAIRARMEQHLPCRVVSTQLVEAGVDLDFDVGFRALGPLDSVFQVAGRVDRNGRLTAAAGQAAGRLVVFRPEDEGMPPSEYSEATSRTSTMAKEALNRGTSIQPESLETMEHYWNRFYGEGAEQGEKFQDYRREWKFATLAKEFEMISTRTLDVYVPYDAESCRDIKRLLGIGEMTLELRRRLQRYVVGVQPNEFQRARRVLEEVRPDTGIWVAFEAAYDSNKGLKVALDASQTMI